MTCHACKYDPNGPYIQVVKDLLLVVVDGEARRLPRRQIELLSHVLMWHHLDKTAPIKELCKVMYPDSLNGTSLLSGMAYDTRKGMEGMSKRLQRDYGQSLYFAADE